MKIALASVIELTYLNSFVRHQSHLAILCGRFVMWIFKIVINALTILLAHNIKYPLMS